MTKKGYKQTLEHKRRRVESRKKNGKMDYSFTQTKEYREKMRERLSGTKNPRWGVHLSQETKAKISESEKGKKVVMTDEHRANLSKALKGKYAGDKSKNWKGGRKNYRIHSPLLYAVRNCGKYYEWRRNILNEAFPNGKPSSFEVQVHHKTPLSLLLKQYSITTLEQALACDALWDKTNAVVMTKSEHYIISVFERRRKPSRGLITALESWLQEGKFKVYPIGEMNGNPYED